MTPPHVSKRANEKGAIIFFVLLAMSLVAFMIRRVTTQTSTYAQLTRAYREGLTAQDALRERIAPPSSSARGCQDEVISIETESRTVAVCSTGAQEFNTFPPTKISLVRIDYNLMFKSPDECPGARRNTAQKSFNTPRSATDCALPAALDNGGIFIDNLEAQDVYLRSSDEVKTLTIATPGYLTITGTLTTMNSLLILAGGDISIENIASNGSKPVRITLVSAHGSTVVQKTSGELSLFILGRTLISAPPTPFLPPFPLPPFRASPPISGIIPTFRG